MSDTKREYWKVKDGMVWGYVCTRFVGSRDEFEICSLEEAEEMSDMKLNDLANSILHESGAMDWGF